MTLAVRMQGVTQRFGDVVALDNVDLEVETGTIHAIVGENGAGKTTLMRILYGALRPTEGTMEIEGHPAKFSTSREAISAGVGMVSQHYGIIPELSALENLILGAEGGAMIDRRACRERAQSLADRMGFSFEWNADAAELSPAGAQKLEILKLLWRKAKIMILDEPTAMLSPQDGEALFQSMRKLANEGATVLLVTHRLPEVMDHCRRVTVLRGGKKVAEREVADTNPNELAELIVGGQTAAHEPPASREPGEVILKVDSLTVGDGRATDKLKAISCQARAGEIVGIAGVDGSGQRELFYSIVGTIRLRSGAIYLGSSDVSEIPTAQRIADGLRVIPEDRHAEAVVESWSLVENSSLGLQRHRTLRKGGFIDASARKKWAEAVAAKFRTRHGGLNLPMSSLSGGNQQRFVAARALELDAKLILAFQPARGLDLGGTAAVYAAIRERCEAGASAIVVSFDLDELLEHTDRILVMNGGELFETDNTKDREAIGRLMVGAR